MSIYQIIIRESKLSYKEQLVCKAIFKNFRTIKEKNKGEKQVVKMDCNNCGASNRAKKEVYQCYKDFPEYANKKVKGKNKIECLGYFFSAPISQEIREIYYLRKNFNDIFLKSNIIKEVLFTCEVFSR